MALTLSIFSLSQYRKAAKSEEGRRREAENASRQSKIAATKSAEAADSLRAKLEARKLTESKAQEAARQQAIAEVNAKRAESNAARARANSFLKASRDTLNSRPDLSALLAVTGGRILEKTGEESTKARTSTRMFLERRMMELSVPAWSPSCPCSRVHKSSVIWRITELCRRHMVIVRHRGDKSEPTVTKMRL